MREVLSWKTLDLDFACVNTMGKNVFHLIAEHQSVDMFTALVKERGYRYLERIKRSLNLGWDNHPQKTPLFYCFPNKELAQLYIKFGAEGRNLSAIQCYKHYKSNLNYLHFAITEFGLDFKEKDVDGNNVMLFAYEE